MVIRDLSEFDKNSQEQKTPAKNLMMSIAYFINLKKQITLTNLAELEIEFERFSFNIGPPNTEKLKKRAQNFKKPVYEFIYDKSHNFTSFIKYMPSGEIKATSISDLSFVEGTIVEQMIGIEIANEEVNQGQKLNLGTLEEQLATAANIICSYALLEYKTRSRGSYIPTVLGFAGVGVGGYYAYPFMGHVGSFLYDKMDIQYVLSHVFTGPLAQYYNKATEVAPFVLEGVAIALAATILYKLIKLSISLHEATKGDVYNPRVDQDYKCEEQNRHIAIPIMTSCAIAIGICAEAKNLPAATQWVNSNVADNIYHGAGASSVSYQVVEATLIAATIAVCATLLKYSLSAKKVKEVTLVETPKTHVDQVLKPNGMQTSVTLGGH